MSIPTTTDTKTCPFCKELIKSVAIKCRHCGELLGDEKNPGLWRDGKLLVMSRKAALPDRCVKSNAPATNWLKREYRWHEGGTLVAFLVGALVYSLISEKIRIQVALSDAMRRRRRWAITIGWSSVVLGLVLFFTGMVAAGERHPSALAVLILVGPLVMLVGGIYGAIRAQTVSMAKADSTHLWLKGVHRDYLADLPNWPGNN